MVAYARVDRNRAGLRRLVMLCALGVALRLLLLGLAGPLELQSDEANYVYLALVWERFGSYQDGFRFLWPPGFAWILKHALARFGLDGLTAVKLLQVAGCASTGLTSMLFARRLFGMRAAQVAGALWVLYLPLAAYTHYLWPEPLFLGLLLPALYLILRALEAPAPRPRTDGELGLAGFLYAGALYLKEAPLFLVPVLALLLAIHSEDRREGLRRASLFLLAIAVALAPWTLRNLEVYGRFVPLASTLGENLHAGVNARYKNYDVQALGERPLGEEALLPEGVGRTWFTELEAEQWERAEHVANTPDRLRENVRRGAAFALEHPAWLARSRIKKLADLFAPSSFFVRHAALGHYDEGLFRRLPREPLVVWAVVCPLLVLPLGMAGFCLCLRRGPARWLIGAVLGYFTCTGLLVAMSRFRLPMIPFLIVLAAGLLTGAAERPVPRGARILAALVLALLVGLWWIDLPEVAGLVELAVGGPG
jgi:4-amino-4-deoxy-L-arabinose transferase-like glycosyltransferase